MQKSDHNKYFKVDLVQVLVDDWHDFIKKIWLYLAIGALVGVIGFVFAKIQYSPTYSTKSTFTVSKHKAVDYHDTIEKNSVSTWIGLGVPGILSTDHFKDMVKDEMGYQEPQSLPATFSASSIKDTNLVSFTVQAGDPQLAYDAMQAALRCLERVEAISAGGVDITMIEQSGVPAAPSGGSGAGKSAVSSFLIGVFLCLVWLTVKNIMKKTIRNGEDLEGFLDMEFLGDLPVSAMKKHRTILHKNTAGKTTSAKATSDKTTSEVSENKTTSNKTTSNKTNKTTSNKTTSEVSDYAFPPELEDAMHRIRHRLEQEADRDKAKAILVTSAIRSEGKTTLAVNLAQALAQRSYNVLLIDGDLRNPSVHTMMGLKPSEHGLAELLAGRCSLEQALVPDKRSDNLVILPGGKPVGKPDALWGSPLAEELIHRARRQCDYVIIDAPAGALVSDPGLIASSADGCIYVVREDYAKSETILEGCATMAGSGCRMLGCVLSR